MSQHAPTTSVPGPESARPLDRRSDPRVPFGRTVRVGPPDGRPEHPVRAWDLSSKGMFIRAGREVEVGAQFSVGIVLSHGEEAYVPRAEVAYNRIAGHTGFGVRFLAYHTGDDERLTHEVQRVVDGRATTRPPRQDEAVDSVASFLADAALTTETPEIEISELSLDPTPSHAPDDPAEVSSVPVPLDTEVPERTRFYWWQDLEAALDGVRHRLLQGGRRLPHVWVGVIAIGILAVLTALGMVLWKGAYAEPPKSVLDARDRGFSADTHQALMGRGALASDLSRAADRPQPAQAQGAPAHAPAPRAMDKTWMGPGPARPARDVPARDAAHARTPGNKAPKKQAPEKLSPRARAVLGAASSGPAERLRPPVGSETVVLAKLTAGASVLKTHLFKKPDRFVVDLQGQLGTPQIAGTAPFVRNVRFGRHADYFRVVIDVGVSLAEGRVRQEGDRLTVVLRPHP